MASNIPATLLDGVTATGVGDSKSAGEIAPAGMSHHGILRNFSIQVVYAGAAPDAATVKFQGTHDGSNWLDLGNTTDISATTVGFAVTNYPFAEVRGNLTAYTAGSCTGVTVTCEGSI